MPQALPIETIPAYGESGPPFLISEAKGYLSREEVTLAIHVAEMPAGLVLGKVTADGTYAPHNPGLSDGTEVAAGILYRTSPPNSATERATVLVRNCEVNYQLLKWDASANTQAERDAAIADLAAAKVIFRAKINDGA